MDSGLAACAAIRNDRSDGPAVIPGRREATSPESITPVPTRVLQRL